MTTDQPDLRICRICGEEKPIELFPYEYNKARGLRRHLCRKCDNEVRYARLSGKIKSRPSKTVAERFWEKVEKGDGCWKWLAANDGTKGKGLFSYEGQWIGAPRACWIIVHGTDPGDLFVCHKCDNPSCVNPSYFPSASPEIDDPGCVHKGRHNRQKLSDADVVAIIEARQGGESIRSIAARFNIGGQYVRKLANGVARGDVHARND